MLGTLHNFRSLLGFTSRYECKGGHELSAHSIVSGSIGIHMQSQWVLCRVTDAPAPSRQLFRG